MRVAFGITALNRGRAQNALDGIANYSQALLRQLQQNTALSVIPFSFSHASTAADNEGALNFGPFMPQAVFAHYSGLSFPLMTRGKLRAVDLVHATDHRIPVSSNVPVLATLMDAIPLSHPEWVSMRFRTQKNALWKNAARKAQHILTISDYSKIEIMRWFDIPEAKISVVPLGVDAHWFDAPCTEAKERLAARYALPPRYFLFLGTLQPRKNLLRLIEAHRRLPAALRHEFPLVVAGRKGWACDAEIAALQSGDKGCLRWLNYVPAADIQALVHGASAVLLPSLYEGFGLPVLEAFAAGAPVICSNTSSLPEVAGDAALLVDPYKVMDISEAMAGIAQDDGLADTLRMHGLERARHFSWQQTAALTAACYLRVGS